MRSQHVHIDVFHFLWCISMIDQYLGRKLVWLCWLLNIIYVKIALPAIKINLYWKYPKTLIGHNLRMSHQNLKRISGIHIDHKRNKIHKNEGFLKKKSLCHTAWFLQKMALKLVSQVFFSFKWFFAFLSWSFSSYAL